MIIDTPQPRLEAEPSAVQIVSMAPIRKAEAQRKVRLSAGLLGSFLLPLLGYAGGTLLVMWPALTRYTTTVMGSFQPDDATSGGVWRGWQLMSLTPFSATTPMLNAPLGAPFWQGTNITALGWTIPQWAFAHLFGPVGSWDFALALGFVLDGLAMYGLVRWLVGRPWIAFVAGLLYAFSPFHVEESYGHIGYVYSWIFPLIVWAGLALIKKPTVLRSTWFGVTIALAAYIDGYYIVFAPLVAVVLSVGGLIWFACRRTGVLHWLRSVLISAGISGALVLPVYFNFVETSTGVVHGFTRPIWDVNHFSARLWEYFLPWTASPFWGSHVTPFFLNQHLGPLGARESTLYLGGAVIVLASSLWLLLPWRLGPFRQNVDHGDGISLVGGPPLESGFALPLRPLSALLLVLTLITMFSSFAMLGPISGLPVRLWHYLPYFRVYSRLFVAVDVGAIAAASIMLAYLSRLTWGVRRLPTGLALAVVLSVLAVLDGTASVPWSSWSYADNTPRPYLWLGHHQDGGIVADYPVLIPSSKWAWAAHLTYQAMYRHPLLDGAPDGTASGDIAHGLSDITDPQTVPALRQYGVKYVVFNHVSYYHLPANWKQYLHGLKLIMSADSVSLFRVLYPSGKQHKSIGIITIKSGFNPERPFVPHLHRWMSGTSAHLGIHPFTSWPYATFTCLLSSFRQPRHVTVSQNGHVLWSRVVWGYRYSRVRVRVSREGDIVIRTTPGARYAPGVSSPDLAQFFSVNVTGLALWPRHPLSGIGDATTN